MDIEPSWSGQPRGRATRRAVAKANGQIVENEFRVKLIRAEVLEMPRVFPLDSMANADAEEWGYARVGSPGGS